jgi:hypothetical protein
VPIAGDKDDPWRTASSERRRDESRVLAGRERAALSHDRTTWNAKGRELARHDVRLHVAGPVPAAARDDNGFGATALGVDPRRRIEAPLEGARQEPPRLIEANLAAKDHDGASILHED